jgi:hypothetical protein
MLRRSNKSAVWKISSSGTPYFLIAAWNLQKFQSKNTLNFMPSANFSLCKPLNVLHQLKICSALLNLLDAARCQFVGKLTKHDAIAQDIFIVTLWNGLTKNGINPFEDFLFLLLITLLVMPSQKERK